MHEDPSPRLRFIFKSERSFNILPTKTFNPFIELYADILPMGFLSRHRYIQKHFPMSSPLAGIQQTSFYCENPASISSTWSKDKSIAIRKAARKIMKARMSFKKLLLHMRFKLLRKGAANTTDIVTGEVPKKPVYIVDWRSRQVYVFEAYTLMKDITERLMHHDGFFEDPQPPRNPFTNIPLTHAQTISVWNSISDAGIPVSSAFTLYRSSRYCMKSFIEFNTTFLKLHSLRKTLREADSYDFRERVLDFIAFSYNVESIDCEVNSFTNALLRYPHHRLIKKWASLCERYYECEILHVGNTAKITAIKEAVLDDTYDILHLQRELVSLNTLMQGVQGVQVQSTSINLDDLVGIIETLDILYVDV